MEGIIFWLVPVLLLSVFLLVLLRHTSENRKPPLLIVEPLGTIISAWQTARVIGDKKQLDNYLSMFRYHACNSGTPLEAIILATGGIEQHLPVTLLHCHGLGLWGEQRIFETADGKILSVMIGDVSEILPKVKYMGAGKAVMTENERHELEMTANRANSHGFLPLACCYRFVHSGSVIEPTGHSWAGFILLEPVLAAGLVKRLGGYRPQDLKMLSVLPPALLFFLRRRLWRTEADGGLPLVLDKGPKEKEEYWDNSSCIGSANLRERYSAVRYFQFGKTCRVLSGNAEDRQLPIATTNIL